LQPCYRKYWRSGGDFSGFLTYLCGKGAKGITAEDASGKLLVFTVCVNFGMSGIMNGIGLPWLVSVPFGGYLPLMFDGICPHAVRDAPLFMGSLNILWYTHEIPN